jgi:hypothetical protein
MRFDDNTYEAVIDKGTLDSILVELNLVYF